MSQSTSPLTILTATNYPISLSLFAGDYVVMMPGVGDGLARNSTTIHLGALHRDQPISVGDFNGDGHSDIGFGIDGQTVTALMGNGHGHFDLQKTLD